MKESHSVRIHYCNRPGLTMAAILMLVLLPLAKALGLFLLDFDVYLETRDADRTAAQVVPALRRFFLSSAAD